MNKIIINGREISNESPCFIIAELSANHNNDFNLAVETIHAMKESGADAVKIQTFTPDTLTIDSKKDYFKIGKDSLWRERYLYDLYKEVMMPWSWQKKLKEIAESLGLVFFSTPTDRTSVDFLENLNAELYKIASFEITDIPLIEYVASKRKPIIFSTGIAGYEEIEDVIAACKKYSNENYIFLKCTSAYPTPFTEVNLNVIPALREKYNCIVGVSDHTMGYVVPMGAVALGGKIIEKHFILDRALGGADSSFSMNPKEFELMVKNVRILEASMGIGKLEVSAEANKNRVFARSLFVVKDIQKGEKITEENVRSIRPGYGMKPKYLDQVLGKKVIKKLEKGTPLSFELIEGYFYES